jgi:hypothetical protein
MVESRDYICIAAMPASPFSIWSRTRIQTDYRFIPLRVSGVAERFIESAAASIIDRYNPSRQIVTVIAPMPVDKPHRALSN